MNCPKCNTALVKSYALGIEIDYCPICNGEWLEHGELDKIMESSEIRHCQPNYNPYNNMCDGNVYNHKEYKQHSYLKFNKIKLNELFD